MAALALRIGQASQEYTPAEKYTFRTEASWDGATVFTRLLHTDLKNTYGTYGVSDFPTTEYGKDKVTKHLDGVWDSRLIKVVGGEAEIDGVNELKRLLSSIQTAHQRYRTQEYEVTVGGLLTDLLWCLLATVVQRIWVPRFAII